MYSFLKRLTLSYNLFTGTLPPEYANFAHLQDLELHGNLLSGEIPSAFYEQESKSLRILNIGDNLLSGTLDTRVDQLSNLWGLFLFLFQLVEMTKYHYIYNFFSCNGISQVCNMHDFPPIANEKDSLLFTKYILFCHIPRLTPL